MVKKKKEITNIANISKYKFLYQNKVGNVYTCRFCRMGKIQQIGEKFYIKRGHDRNCPIIKRNISRKYKVAIKKQEEIQKKLEYEINEARSILEKEIQNEFNNICSKYKDRRIKIILIERLIKENSESNFTLTSNSNDKLAFVKRKKHKRRLDISSIKNKKFICWYSRNTKGTPKKVKQVRFKEPKILADSQKNLLKESIFNALNTNGIIFTDGLDYNDFSNSINSSDYKLFK